ALAKFGQLFLQKGRWNGKQLLPAAWVEEASAFHIQQPGGDKPGRPKAENDWLQGYGYQFWRCQHGHYRGDGAFGQFTIVLPEHDAVVVMTSENKNMQGQLDLVWQHLLPAFKTGAPPAANAGAGAEAKLAAALAALKLPLPQGRASSPVVERIGGKTYQVEANALGITQVSFAFHGGRSEFTARTAAGSHVIRCGVGHWQNGGSDLPGTPPRLISGGKPKTQPTSKVAANAVWQDDSTLVMTWRYYETPHRDTVTCLFEGDRVSIRFLNSIAAMSDKPADPRPELVGKLAG
ncbi:MAG TPA: serine hydrolase, partial [Prosthecobacter sp.]